MQKETLCDYSFHVIIYVDLCYAEKFIDVVIMTFLLFVIKLTEMNITKIELEKLYTHTHTHIHIATHTHTHRQTDRYIHTQHTHTRTHNIVTSKIYHIG